MDGLEAKGIPLTRPGDQHQLALDGSKTMRQAVSLAIFQALGAKEEKPAAADLLGSRPVTVTVLPSA